MITISIVSHGQASLTANLLSHLVLFRKDIESVIVIKNIPEDDSFDQYKDKLPLVVISNKSVLGFGANHNQAFKLCKTRFFCIMNPDISLIENPFPILKANCLDSDTAVTAPIVLNKNNVIENSARYFPTLRSLLTKFRQGNDNYPIDNKKIVYPDWVAGMFLFFKADAYKNLSGFDESFFLYYEDVDICTRAWKSGYKIKLCTEVKVIHDARKSSHKEFKFLKWHVVSLFRYFLKYQFRLPIKKIL